VLVRCPPEGAGRTARARRPPPSDALPPPQ
jgi:hypothetical protein